MSPALCFRFAESFSLTSPKRLRSALAESSIFLACSGAVISRRVNPPIFQNCPSRTQRGKDAKCFAGVTVETDQLCRIILLNRRLVFLSWLRQRVTFVGSYRQVADQNLQ